MENDRGIGEEIAPILEQEVERRSRQSDDHVNSVVAVFLAQVIAQPFFGEAVTIEVFGVIFDRAGGRRRQSRLNALVESGVGLVVYPARVKGEYAFGPCRFLSVSRAVRRRR